MVLMSTSWPRIKNDVAEIAEAVTQIGVGEYLEFNFK